jgi:hypothetical protein
MSKPLHARALDTLVHRTGSWSRVHLRSGQTCLVWDIAWGFDLGEDVAHITTNISPGPGVECAVDFFHADEILRIEDEENGAILLEDERE